MFSFLKPQFKVTQPRKIRPTMLLILDGWGIAPPSRGNVISQAKLHNLEYYFANYPHAELIAAGESVGLPANEVGNTEVGHLTLGSGRVTYQGLKRINMAVEDGSFFRTPAFRKVIEHIKAHNSRLHIMGMLSSGNVHASLPHFYALLEMCRQNGLVNNNVFVHGFTDGRDAPPKLAETLIPEIEEKMKTLNVGHFATLSGRYYAMDRDRRWDRVEKAYQAIIKKAKLMSLCPPL
jgi:2,3-bisphosphoglycerate-independent phosphoglycerate mutase